MKKKIKIFLTIKLLPYLQSLYCSKAGMINDEITSQEFGQLFLKYRDRFIAIARSYVRDEVAAEDIVAESFTVFWDSRKEIDIATVPEAYILQMVKNRCINYLRDKANRLRIQQKMHEDSYKAIMAEIGVLGKDELGLIFRSDIATIFKNLLDSIPESTRDIFLASRFENLTYNEIAEKYGVSPRKVKREIQHVLEIMRISLKDYLPLLLIVYSLLNE